MYFDAKMKLVLDSRKWQEALKNKEIKIIWMYYLKAISFLFETLQRHQLNGHPTENIVQGWLLDNV